MSKKVCLFFIICFLLPLSGKTQGFVKSEKEDFEWRVIGRTDRAMGEKTPDD